MAYSVQLCTSDALTSFMMRATSVDMGFPHGNFDYLVYSQWMCGPYNYGPSGIGPCGIGCIGDVFTFSYQGLTLTNGTLSGSGQIYSGTFDPSLTYNLFSHMIFSVDTARQIAQVYINDAAAPLTGTWDFSPPTHLNIGYYPAGYWGWNPSGTLITGKYAGIGDIWCAAPSSFVNLDVVSNRRAFINADLSPVDLGTTGVALGITPQMYFTVRPGGVATDIITNRGIGQSCNQAATITFQAPGQCTMPTPPVTPPPAAGIAMDSLLVTGPAMMPTDTRIFLDWSDDRGHSYKIPVGQDIGQPGAYLTALQWQRLGYGRDRVFRLTWSAPVATALQGAWVQVLGTGKT